MAMVREALHHVADALVCDGRFRQKRAGERVSGVGERDIRILSVYCQRPDLVFSGSPGHGKATLTTNFGGLVSAECSVCFLTDFFRSCMVFHYK